jgi:Mn-dependent DtxR family transcriptional regulator
MAADVWKQFELNPISHSAAHHLTAIAELRETVGYARVSDVARLLNITRGSASLTLKALKQRGLVVEDANRFMQLSEEGKMVADSVRGKKYLFEEFLHDVLKVSLDTADEDTCKIEHLVSNETAERLARFMRFVKSNDPRALAFRAAWANFNDCDEHDPAKCPACNVGCMVSLCEAGDRTDSCN